MTKYLQIDIVDDFLNVDNGIAYNKVVMDVLIDNPNDSTLRYLIDSLSRSSGGYIRYNGSSWQGNMSPTGLKFGARTIITAQISAPYTGWIKFFKGNGSAGLSGNVYDIKLYNGATLVGWYDMSTGTVQDQSGNGNHATLTGGTWLDDGAGGDTGTDGAITFDLRQSLYSDGAVNGDIKQSLYSDTFTAFDTLQQLYESGVDGSFSLDILVQIYSDGITKLDTKQAVYSDVITGYDTRFSLYQDSIQPFDLRQQFYRDASTLFDTLQEFFSDGIVGSTPFDIRMVLYADNSAVFDSKQAFYTDGATNADLAQQFYQAGGTASDLKLVIYADASSKFDASQTIYSDASVKADTVQRFYTDGTLDFDTLQAILEDWNVYNEVIKIVLNVTQSKSATLGITQRQQTELKM